MKSSVLFAAGIGLLVVPALSSADLVLEQAENSRLQDREGFRSVVGVAQKFPTRPAPQVLRAAPAGVLPAPAAPVQAFGAQTQAPATFAAPEPEISTLSRSELMRRERVRQELRNEDAIQERLEELRLRDERRRVGQVANESDVVPMGQAAAPLREEVVAAPVTENPGQPQVLPPVSSDFAPEATQMVQFQGPSAGMAAGASVVAAPVAPVGSDSMTIHIAPRVGVSNYISPDPALTVNGRYTLGASLGIDATESMAIELGYQFSEYGVALQPSTVGFSYLSPTGMYETRMLRQNLVDLGLKFYLLGSGSRIRPYIGGGGAWQNSYLNFDNRYRMMMGTYGVGQVRDFEASSFLGQLSAGLDVRVNRSITIGAGFRYYSVLSATSGNQIPYSAMWGFQQPGMGFGMGGLGTGEAILNQEAGLQLQRASFYSIFATVGFSF